MSSSKFDYKAKSELVDKEEYFCESCKEKHYGVLFCFGSNHMEIDDLPKSVWSDLEEGEEYWFSLRKV